MSLFSFFPNSRLQISLATLTLLSSLQAMASYDPCQVKQTHNDLAESQCFNVQRPLASPYAGETSFSIRTVLMTESLQTKDSKPTMIIVPGGPGTDSQAIRVSLNNVDLLNAFWKHLNLNVVLYDPRATGASKFQKPAELYDQHFFNTEDQVIDLLKVIEAVSPNKPVILFAHSAGGDLAARVAADYPERVGGLVLYSASIDAREIGESNLRSFADAFQYWSEFLKRQSPETARHLEDQRLSIESFLKNVLKLQRLKSVRPPSLRNFYLGSFRAEVVQAVENSELNLDRVQATLDTWTSKISNLTPEIRSMVNEQKDLKFNLSNYTPQKIVRGDWIKTAVICSEGITKTEIQSALWLDGLIFSQDTCQKMTAIYDSPPSRDWLKKIKAPTLLIGGTEDPSQIPSAVRRNANAIANSQVHMFQGGGHESHLTHTMEFYKMMDKYLAGL